MSITAISSALAAIGGKAALPGTGEILSGNGLPIDFAALLAEQIPPSSQTTPALLSAETIPLGQQLDTELLSGIIAKTSTAKDKSIVPVDDKALSSSTDLATSAEGVLAALSASPGQPATTVTTPDSKKEGDDKERKLAADSDAIPAEPGLAAQYVIPMATPPVQNRLPESVDRSKQNIPAHMTKADGIETSGKEGRPALAEQRNPLQPGTNPTASPAATLATPAPESRIHPRSDTANTAIGTPAPESWIPPRSDTANTAIATPAPESRIPPRSDTANTAIIAGDSNSGNGGNTSAFASALAATGTPGATASSTPPTQHAAVTTPLSSPNWSQDFGTRVAWLAKNDHQVAQISINPPQLGPVQISISLNGDQAIATFTSPHPEVRQAIQDSLPQLREMLTSAGISLGQANVGSQLPSQNREAAYQFANEARSSGENAILSPDSHSSSNSAGIPIQRGRGLVDLFA